VRQVTCAGDHFSEKFVCCRMLIGAKLFGSWRSKRRLLTQVRHGLGQERIKLIGISSGSGEVCTTFLIEIEPIGDVDVQLLEEGLLFARGRGDAAQADLAAIGGG